MLFAFDEGEGLSEHTSPFDALVQIVEGEAEIKVSGQPHRVKAGELILMPAGQPHALKALKRFKMVLTMIRPSVGVDVTVFSARRRAHAVARDRNQASRMVAWRDCLNCSTSFSWAALTSASVRVRSGWR